MRHDDTEAKASVRERQEAERHSRANQEQEEGAFIMATPSLIATCAICNAQFEARTSYGLCARCWSRDRLREIDRLTTALKHAERAKLPATLSLKQWLCTASDFKGLCAYCLEVPFSFIEAVNPLEGVVWGNVVTICRACASIKKQTFDAAKNRVQAYLSGVQEDAEVCGDEAIIPEYAAMIDIFPELPQEFVSSS